MDITTQKCIVEQQVLNNAPSLSSIAPNVMVYTMMKRPGYMAIPAAEVIHLIKCISTEVRIRQVEEYIYSYKELPITHQNKSCFLLPKTRIITREGTLRDCNKFLPNMYNLHGIWYRVIPKLVESIPPPMKLPLTRPKWKYIDPEHLGTSGIYSNDDLNKLQAHIIEPVKKPAILDTLAKGISGKNIPAGKISLYNLMDEDSLEKIAMSTGERLWGAFVTFGSVSAEIHTIFIILRTIKYMADTLLHDFALHGIYGWSKQIVGALWGSLTHLLLHLARKPKE